MDSLYLRYSTALLDIAEEEKKIEEYKEALSVLNDTFKSEPKIKEYLDSYFVEFNDKEEMVNNLTKEFKLKNLNHFLLVLIKNHRFHDYSKFEKEFRKLANKKIGVLDGFIYSVNPMDQKDINKIEKSLTSKLGKKVELENKIDTNLIGGVKVFVDDHVYDGSLKGQIDKLGKDLRKGDSL